jgi:hypothetical protein
VLHIHAEPLAGSRKDRADTVNGNVKGRANLLIASPLQIAQADHFPLSRRKLSQELLYLFQILQSGLGLGRGFPFPLNGTPVRLGLHLAGCGSPSELMDAVPACDDRQISRQAALAAKLTECGVIVGDELEEDFGNNVFRVLGRKRSASLESGMMNDVIDQAEEPVDKVVPSSAVMIQASLQERTVHSRKRHSPTSILSGPDSVEPPPR